MNANPPIVVGVDGSAPSSNAVRWAARAAALRGAPLVLLTTQLGAYSSGDFGLPADFVAAEEIANKNRLSRAAELAATAAQGIGSLEVQTALQDGPAIVALLDRSRSARMVVVGSRGLGEFTGGLVGSVSSAVVTHASCPVVVLHELPGPEGPTLDGPVVVGVDGSKASVAAIGAAFEEASLRGADLVAVHAWTDMNLAAVYGLYSNEAHADWAALETGQHAVLAESMAGWGEQHPDVTVRQVVVEDRPVRNLLQQAEHAQLLVVGSRGRGGFTSMLLGSTSRTLLHSVTRPLMVVR